MAGIKNKYEFYKGFLEALGAQDVKETEYKNEEELRKKILDTMGVEYVFDDVNQTDLFRGKFLEGLANGGGGGESDFSTAEVTVINDAANEFLLIIPNIFDNILASELDSADIDPDTPLIVPLYKGRIEIGYPAISFEQKNFSYLGSEGVSVNQFGKVVISGTGTLTITDSLN